MAAGAWEACVLTQQQHSSRSSRALTGQIVPKECLWGPCCLPAFPDSPAAVKRARARTVQRRAPVPRVRRGPGLHGLRRDLWSECHGLLRAGEACCGSIDSNVGRVL